MYSVMLVDDEINVIKVLRKLIDWEKYGFGVIADAYDGVQALEMIEKLRPDLVITDVDMPYLNGIQLVRQIAERKYECKTLLLTVYKDFQYIKSAMDCGTMGYLLKPVDEAELVESLVRIRKELDGSKLLSEALHVIKERFLRSLMEGRDNYEAGGAGKSDLGITFSEGDSFAVMLAEIDNVFDINPSEIDIEGVYRTVAGIVDNIANRSFSGCSFRDSMERVCVLLWHADKGKLEPELSNMAEEFRSIAVKRTGLTITVGMSRVLRGSGNLKNLYDEAVRTLETAFLLGKNRVISHTEGLYFENVSDRGECGSLLIELCKSVENFDTSNAGKILDRIFNIITVDKVGEKRVKELVAELFIEVGRVIRECNGDIYNVFGDAFNIFDFLQKRSTIREYKEWLNKVINDSCRYIKDIKVSRPKSIVTEVIDYIRQNYHKDLTLKLLAELFYLNPLYLGQIFKKDTGESFNDFLARVRIENAVRLLKNTNLKVYEIAEKVGFKELQYYYKTFKSITGASPTAFRTND